MILALTAIVTLAVLATVVIAARVVIQTWKMHPARRHFEAWPWYGMHSEIPEPKAARDAVQQTTQQRRRFVLRTMKERQRRVVR